METLLDYVKWMGKYDFTACPFQEADALVLCVISYFDLSPLFQDTSSDSEVYVRDCIPMVEAGQALLLITGGDLGNGELFAEAVHSKRFGDLRISNYEDILQEEPPLQFAAMTFHDADRFHFIAYRGTDSSLAGWKENFMISFTRTKAQELAAEYAERMISTGSASDRTWYISGHSKGGNLALYAACMLSDEALSRVKRVYSLDGPGFCPEVNDPDLIERIDAVTTRIIPEFDVVGMLFEPKITDTKIVKSFRDGIVQHSLPSWLVDHGDLALAERNAALSLRMNEILDAWIENRPPEDRAIFIDELFDVLAQNGVSDLSSMKVETLADVIMNLRDASDTTKETLADLRRRALLGERADESPTLQQVEEQAAEKIVQLSPQEKQDEIQELFKTPGLLQGVCLIPAGILISLASERFLDIICLVLVLVMAGLQLYLTVRRLSKNQWKFSEYRESIYFTIVLVALIPALFIKEQAMFFFGSLIVGILLLVGAYQAGERAYRNVDSRFLRGLYMAECAVAAVFGLSFLIIPRASVAGYAISIGISMILDGLVRSGYALWRKTHIG